MIGAIAGDIIGSRFEFDNLKSKEFEFFHPKCDFTDDTVCTLAVADCIMQSGDFAKFLGKYTLTYPGRGYGNHFAVWAKQWKRKPYGSYGNGSAMRVSAIPHLLKDERDVLDMAEKSAVVTHNHPDAVIGAQATAWTMWAFMNGAEAKGLRGEIETKFGYDLSQSVDEIREWYSFDIRCSGTVPPAITCALEATGFEDAIRNAISIGGDSDTVACITGGIAEVMFGIDPDTADRARGYLFPKLKGVLEKATSQSHWLAQH